jgi:hypothetical protein
MTYSVISTISAPSSINNTIKCNFTSTLKENLIISKINTLEIFTLTEIEILPNFKINLFGRISNLLSYRPKVISNLLLINLVN